MNVLVETVSRFRLGLFLWLLMAAPLMGQTSNRVWFAINNGTPTPSADVAVQSLRTDGSASLLSAGAATSFVVQTNLTTLNSPYDIVVDPAMGKVYVLDNNVSGTNNEYIYSFNLAGSPAQITASKQIIYTMPPAPTADVVANAYPLVSGIALDSSRHALYFCQVDLVTATNSYLGRIDLTSSAAGNLHSSNSGKPAVQTFHAGQIPGVGPIALDDTNVYIGAINARLGNGGIYAAPRDSNTAFNQLVNLSAGNTQFTNGFPSGVACDSADHLLYYLTFNAGILNQQFNLGQNAVWSYDLATHASQKISSGYGGYPDNLTLDAANRRYYFTVGRDGTGNAAPTNYQAIYSGNSGTLGSAAKLYQPVLVGQDVAGQINAGQVALQGIFVEDPPQFSSVTAAVEYPVLGSPVTLASTLILSDYSSTTLSNAQVRILDGPVAGDSLAVITTGTAIAATYDAQAETLTLTGNDTVTNYQQVLRSVTFSSTNANPTLNHTKNQRTINWSAYDGGLAANPVTTVLNLVTINTNLLNHLSVSAVTNGWLLQYYGTASQKYVAQKALSANGPWTDLSPVLIADGTGSIVYTDQTVPLPAVRFYRIRTGP